MLALRYPSYRFFFFLFFSSLLLFFLPLFVLISPSFHTSFRKNIELYIGWVRKLAARIFRKEVALYQKGSRLRFCRVLGMTSSPLFSSPSLLYAHFTPQGYIHTGPSNRCGCLALRDAESNVVHGHGGVLSLPRLSPSLPGFQPRPLGLQLHLRSLHC